MRVLMLVVGTELKLAFKTWWPKATIKKVSKQAHLGKIKENVGMDWWKKYGDKVGMECVQCPTPQATPTYTYPYMWCL